MSVVDQSPEGVRLNNPGCLRKAVSPDSKTTLVNGYAQFISWHEGCENLAWLIWIYYHDHGFLTPRAFVSRYAPSIENDTLGYICWVCNWFNIPITHDGIADLRLDEPQRAVEMMKCISTRECGWKSTQTIPHETYISNEDAYQALAVVGKWK